MSDLASRRHHKDLTVITKAPQATTGPTVGSAEESPNNQRLIRKLEEGESFADYYEFDQEIYNAGSKGKVVNAKSKATNEWYVVKIRRKAHFRGSEQAWRGITERILNMDRCIHILDIFEIVEDNEAYHVVMDKCSGGELFKFLLTETTVPERECKRIMVEILKAVKHLHDRGIIHRDIKPENIMFHKLDTRRDVYSPSVNRPPNQGREGETIKLIDFDTCQEWTPSSPRSRRIIGTLGYIAPEGYLGQYSPASDLWSVGVILYILMTGDMPFDDDIFGDNVQDNTVGSAKMQEIYKKIQQTKVDWDCPPWPQFPLARDLCQKLMAFDVECRSPSALDALKHPWLNDSK